MRYALLVCADETAVPSEAIEVAAKVPAAWYGSIEVRPVSVRPLTAGDLTGPAS